MFIGKQTILEFDRSLASIAWDPCLQCLAFELLRVKTEFGGVSANLTYNPIDSMLSLFQDLKFVFRQIAQVTGIYGNGEAGVTAPDIQAYMRDTHSFEHLGGVGFASYELSGIAEPAQVNASRLSAGTFLALGVAPLLGRTVTAEEDERSQQVAVLSYPTWQSRFNGNPHVLGSKILLDRKPYLVIGVMPRQFEFPLVPGRLNRCELWVPMSLTHQELTQGAASWNYGMVGRLKSGVAPSQAQSDAARVAKEIMLNYPAFMKSLHISPVVRPLQEETVEQARPLVRTLFLAVAVVLLIACANLAGLMVVRAIHRQREVAVRLALGARAAALLREAILESLTISVGGGLLGLALAALALGAGRNLLPESLPRISEISLNWNVVGFALLLAVVTGVLCGLAPAFVALRTSVNDTL
ncbi:MAG: ABC transporter permease [Acidobacteriaceae bacterium]|nr:ABC transporter permease [Acidobacteriaceae bacterium]